MDVNEAWVTALVSDKPISLGCQYLISMFRINSSMETLMMVKTATKFEDVMCNLGTG